MNDNKQNILTSEEMANIDRLSQLLLNNKISYSDVPFSLRKQSPSLFSYALRAARDHLQSPEQTITVIELFLLDIEAIEKEYGRNMQLRHKATNAIVSVKYTFTGVESIDTFIEQQERTRSWLFENRGA